MTWDRTLNKALITELFLLKRQERPTKEHPIARQVIITIVADALPNRLLYDVAI